MGRKKTFINKCSAILSKEGYKYFDWNDSTADADPNMKKYRKNKNIGSLLANNVIKNSNNRKKLIILMHDSSDKIYTAKALPKIIEGLKKQGYSFDVLTNY
jgi:peptidoglycan/xylan/chitin deacetylase (PgdA/CDA1 family)